MIAGTIINIKGRGMATVVYNHLDGVGVVWGEPEIDITDLPMPEAMLRGDYKNSFAECLGDNIEYTVIDVPMYEDYNPSCPPMFE